MENKDDSIYGPRIPSNQETIRKSEIGKKCMELIDRIESRNNDAEWDSVSYEAPPDLKKSVDVEFEAWRNMFDSIYGWEPKKIRHFYVILLAEGLSAVQNMELHDMLQRIDELLQ